VKERGEAQKEEEEAKYHHRSEGGEGSRTKL